MATLWQLELRTPWFFLFSLELFHYDVFEKQNLKSQVFQRD